MGHLIRYADPMTLDEFLLARITEEDADVRVEVEVHREAGFTDEQIDGHGYVGDWGPARVLAECDARRQLIHEWQTFGNVAQVTPRDERGLHVQLSAVGITQGLERALRHMALPYADHPDYQPDWKP